MLVLYGGNVMWDPYGEEGCIALSSIVEKFPVIITVEWRGMSLAFSHGGWPAYLSNISPILFGNLLNKKSDLEKEKICESVMWVS